MTALRQVTQTSLILIFERSTFMGNAQPSGRSGDSLAHLKWALGRIMSEGEAEFSFDLSCQCSTFIKDEALPSLCAFSWVFWWLSPSSRSPKTWRNMTKPSCWSGYFFCALFLSGWLMSRRVQSRCTYKIQQSTCLRPATKSHRRTC